MKTLVIIPALDEEESLPGVLAALRAQTPELDVVVVDDGSKDATASVARNAGVAVVSLPYNLGVGGAMRTGFRYALRLGYERAVQLDADGQHDPTDAVRLLAELDAGADLVVGSRFANNDGHYEVGRTRRAAMRVMRRAVKIVSGREFTDPSSGFRAFSRPMLELFAANYSVDYLADTVEALLTAVRSGMRVVEVPVTMRVRAGGAPSTRNVKLVYHYLRLLVVVVTSVTRRHRRPHEEGSSWSPSPT
ncbi:MAG TPA: glycosyltransferase family 2 protein [Acidimicrobiales bacterium]|jgi:glycosyltransferase involved in cell wall biosynthesis|nr:glycosyltransferase family 2 protein [Acidimicrobiales bacterium]